MDLDEAHMKDVVHFQSGQAYVYLENWDGVRRVDMKNYKGEFKVEEPQSDEEIKDVMSFFENNSPELFSPFKECLLGCSICDRRTRSQAETFVKEILGTGTKSYNTKIKNEKSLDGVSEIEKRSFCGHLYLETEKEYNRLCKRYTNVSEKFPFCAYVHLINSAINEVHKCKSTKSNCKCKTNGHEHYFDLYLKMGLKK